MLHDGIESVLFICTRFYTIAHIQRKLCMVPVTDDVLALSQFMISNKMTVATTMIQHVLSFPLATLCKNTLSTEVG